VEYLVTVVHRRDVNLANRKFVSSVFCFWESCTLLDVDVTADLLRFSLLVLPGVTTHSLSLSFPYMILYHPVTVHDKGTVSQAVP
jgi:hypothetical protein